MKHAKQRELYCVILCQTTHGTKRAQKDKPKNVWDKARLMREVDKPKNVWDKARLMREVDKPKNVWDKARLMREVRRGQGGKGGDRVFSISPKKGPECILQKSTQNGPSKSCYLT